MTYLGLTLDQWKNLGLSVLIVIASAIIGRWFVLLLMRRVLKRAGAADDTTLNKVLFKVLWPPIYWLAVMFALRIALTRLDFLPASWDEPLAVLLFLGNFCIGFSAAWRLTTHLTTWYAQEVAPRTETELDNQIMPFFRRMLLIGVSLVGLIILLAHFDIDVSPLVTTLGIGSLAIALAAQAALSDIISGFVIMIDRPFRIGDRIEIQALDTWGDVVDIGLRSTSIRTRDNRMVIVPNSVIGKSLIVNYTFPDTQYRIQVHIGVAYGSDLELVRDTMIGAVRNVEGVLPDQLVEALFLEFGDSALIFRLRWWIDSYVDTRRMFDRVNTAVYEALRRADIEIPNPQLDVHHRLPQGGVKDSMAASAGMD
jgi:small-conductance mechanosensitive channel